MEKRTKNKTIEVFVASDGIEFPTENECLCHEKVLLLREVTASFRELVEKGWYEICEDKSTHAMAANGFPTTNGLP